MTSESTPEGPPGSRGDITTNGGAGTRNGDPKTSTSGRRPVRIPATLREKRGLSREGVCGGGDGTTKGQQTGRKKKRGKKAQRTETEVEVERYTRGEQ
ncbi:hypothetical protein NDU88_003752 [Pleurodeles waltl]|uniref:Uncharacterized protein n=1 Tax=Pleurodeles waltl TaxID=8319 RepID=A0AAV7T5K1_PLEWA|nr:hypothetical protein NDU88_003752 [Pleurodeles waltl]